MPQPAYRLQTLPAYPLAVLNQRVRELNAKGMDVIGLDVGSPDMPPPEIVIDALDESIHHAGHHSYSGYKGTPAFRAAVAQHYKERFGVTINPNTQVLPLIGSKEGIVNLSLAYLDRGDIALVPSVGYPSYALGAQLAGAEAYWLPVDEAGGYLPDFASIPSEVLSRAKLMWVNYPSNPTGATAELDFYQRAVDFCREHNILLASDNPYVDVTFDGYIAGSALQAENAQDITVEFISFSKTYNMAGWRLGAAVGNAEGINTLLQIKSNTDSGHFEPIYDAGIIALEQVPRSWINERNAVYQRRRDLILERLPRIGLSAQKTNGSLYVWAKVAEGNGGTYAEAALVNAHVSVAPGQIYGPGGMNYVRISLGTPDVRLQEALDRLEKWYVSR